MSERDYGPQSNPLDFNEAAVSSTDQSFYDDVKNRFKHERDIRLGYRPPGSKMYQDFSGDLANYEADPYSSAPEAREPIEESVEVLFIGGGFSALLTSARLKEKGVDSIRIIERGADFGGSWYWNRYPGVACDIIAYDYLPLLDETGYVPSRRYARGDEIFAYCKLIGERYDLYRHAAFQTTVNSTVWNEESGVWDVKTDRGDHIKAKFVVCANGSLAKPKVAMIDGILDFAGHSFHTSRWDYDYTGKDLENLADKKVAIIGTGASAVQVVGEISKKVGQLYVFQRTPSAIFDRDDWETDPEWAASLEPGWQASRRQKAFSDIRRTQDEKAKFANETREEKLRRLENANIDTMMTVHSQIENIVKDPETAEALKPWYMLLCKRPCIHNEYLPSFNLPNVRLVDTKGKGVTNITEAGPEFEGEIFDVDLIIYATGFEVQKTGIYNRIVGKADLQLEDKHKDGYRTVLGIHSHGFPNFFVMGGLQAFFSFNLTDVLNCQGEHIAECIDFMRKTGRDVMDVTASTEEWWVQKVIENRGKTDRNKECTPGYFNMEGAENRRQDGPYNGSMLEYLDYMAQVRGEMDRNFEFLAKAEGEARAL